MVKIGTVISIDDENDGDRIQVALLPNDRTKSEIQKAFPLMPKMMHVKPKVGEAVLIFNADDNNADSQRYYLGPLISQKQFMYYDDAILGGTSTLDGGSKQPASAITRNPNTEGAFPQDDDIGILGRRNCDIILKDSDIRIMCGVKVTDPKDKTDIYFNRLNPAYIKLQYDDSPNYTCDGEKINGSHSVATVVANDINLISVDGDGGFDVTDKDSLITDEQMEEILKKAHELPYGDTLVEFLKLFKKAFNSHTHPWAGLRPIPNNEYIAMNEYDMNKLLSKHIRIN